MATKFPIDFIVTCLIFRFKFLSHSIFLVWNLELLIQKLKKLIGDFQSSTILIKIQIPVDAVYVDVFLPFFIHYMPTSS